VENAISIKLLSGVIKSGPKICYPALTILHSMKINSTLEPKRIQTQKKIISLHSVTCTLHFLRVPWDGNHGTSASWVVLRSPVLFHILSLDSLCVHKVKNVILHEDFCNNELLIQ